MEREASKRAKNYQVSINKNIKHKHTLFLTTPYPWNVSIFIYKTSAEKWIGGRVRLGETGDVNKSIIN